MKILIIGGNRFVGLRLSLLLDKDKSCDLHILNRTGQAAHVKNAAIFKGTRDNLAGSHVDKDWDVVVDFACFNYMQARSSIGFFGKVGRYIHISTGSVYDEGKRLREEETFDPVKWQQHEIPSEEEKKNPYQFGKRQAEAAFTQEAKFPTLLLRFPFILGLDDYTRRLDFHIKRIERGESIYMPNPEAHIALVDSTDAANFLQWSLTQTLTGPLNVASPQDIQLGNFLGQISRRVGRKAQLSTAASLDNSSPYGVSHDASMNVKKMQTAGFTTRPLDAWLPDLIDNLASSDGSQLH